MYLEAALTQIETLYIETSPFIYFVEKHPNYLEKVRKVFEGVSAADLSVKTSIITLAEVLVMPIETDQKEYQRQYREMLLNTRNIESLSVTSAIAEQTAQLRVKYRLRTPDAIHVATAIVAKCDALLTNDRGLVRVNEVQVLVLDDLELEPVEDS